MWEKLPDMGKKMSLYGSIVCHSILQWWSFLHTMPNRRAGSRFDDTESGGLFLRMFRNTGDNTGPTGLNVVYQAIEYSSLEQNF